MIKKIGIAAVLAVFFWGTTGYVVAGAAEAGSGIKDVKQLERAGQDPEKGLGLSEEQRTQMKALREASRAKMDELRAQIKVKSEALGQEMESPQADQAKAQSIVKEINALQAEMTSARVENLFKVKAILTPEQFAKFQENHKKNRGKIKARHENMRQEKKEEKEKEAK